MLGLVKNCIQKPDLYSQIKYLLKFPANIMVAIKFATNTVLVHEEMEVCSLYD